MIDGRLPIDGLDPDSVARRLEAVRERTLALVAGLDWETLRRQHVSILSPMVWDLGHIGNFEELWLGRELAGVEPLRDDLDRMFDAIANPRPSREALPVPVGRALLEYLDEVRRQTLEISQRTADLERRDLLASGFVYEMVAEHEEQHQETLLQALQLLDETPYAPGQRRRLPPGRFVARDMVVIPGGISEIGASSETFVYDNERRRHRVELGDFLIDRTPVTNSDFLVFVEESGYSRRELWSEAGWAWREESGAEMPGNWMADGDGYRARYMNRVVELPLAKPVVHVCYHEAEAYARFVGKRLPTEAEWEKAALWDPEAGEPRLYPWGDEPPAPGLANLDQLAFEPAEVGAYPEGVSAYGVHQMLGDVWEWTASDFAPYPGFEAFPYPEYSEVHFGADYKVLRGGSWATRPAVARGTFRNWDFPVRRQIFAGFRCAADVD